VDRRTFLTGTAALTAASFTPARAADGRGSPEFHTANTRWQFAYDRALQVLSGNVQPMDDSGRPVLIEGSVYQGIWMECGPHEALVYRKFRPDVARNCHMIFFDLQKEDGQIPANRRRTLSGFGQIQMVVPIAATAWELAQATGDSELLERAYVACGKWDAWLRRYRNTRGTGLVEGFCTYDTGMDNSPRWAGLPDACPDRDATRHADLPRLPFLSPDLSATMVGARRAMAEMARALGKMDEADRWAADCEALRANVIGTLWVVEDGAFYDLDAEQHFVRVRSDILSRVASEHVPDQRMFELMWAKQLGNPSAFWSPYPLPSAALDDPTFVRPIPRNSWGGAAQALTALRAGRWMEHYGRTAEFARMQDAWCDAILRDPSFRQQIDPLTGVFTQEDAPGYSPAALVMLDYTWRLAGVREAGDVIEWNVRPGHPAADRARFTLPLDGGGAAEMVYDARGADLTLAGKGIGRVEGVARLVTDRRGVPSHLVGISAETKTIILRWAGRPARRLAVGPGRRIDVSQA
jgi:hypothetical protein